MTDVVRRARQHGAPDDDHVVRGLVFQRLADLLADALEVLQVEAAVAAARRADAQERHLALPHRVRRIGGGAKASLRYVLRQQLVEARLDDRAAARVDRRNLVGVHVDADDIVPIAGKRRGRHTSHVPETEH